ncbi:MAG TPA: hypothetical protein VFH51_20265, partial [Myxococcota bacterium]|nr:hypothetical protein [Myxococcota bacterium]
MLPAMDAAGKLTYRAAGAKDLRVVVDMLGELVDELGPNDMADRVKPLLEEDIRLALASKTVRIFLAEVDGEAVGLSRG